MNRPSPVRNAVEKSLLYTLGTGAFLTTDTLFRLLPERTGYRFARLIGSTSRPPAVRPRMQAMMRAVVGDPHRTETAWRELVHENIHWVGRTLIEHHYWQRLSLAELHRRVVVEGTEHLRTALDRGRGAMLFGNHLGNFLSFIIAAKFFGDHVISFGNLMPVPVMERRLQAFCRRCGHTRLLVGQGLSRRAAEIFARNGVVITFNDLTTVEHHTTWVRFGHAEARVSAGPARLALRHDVPTLAMGFDSLADGRHRITIHPLLERPATGHLESDARDLTQRTMDVFRDELLRRPAQWWQWDAVRFRERTE